MSYQPFDILSDCRRRLERSEKTRLEIAAGADVGIDWLNKLAQGHNDNPTWRPLLRLHEYLINEQKNTKSGKKRS